MKLSLNSNQLKLIAIILMAFDHYVAVLHTNNAEIATLLRIPGRIVAPIMCFFIAEGYYKTSNIKKYILRLLIFTIVSQLPYVLYFKYGLFEKMNIFYELMLGLICLTTIKTKKLDVFIKTIIVLFSLLFSLWSDYGITVILWILSFGLLHNKKLYQFIAFTLVSLITMVLPIYFQFGFDINNRLLLTVYISQLCILLSIPFLYLYNGERGKKSKTISLLFYFFYPIHLMILYLFTLI